MLRTRTQVRRRLAASAAAGVSALVLVACGGNGTTSSGVSTRAGPHPSTPPASSTTSGPGTTHGTPRSETGTGTVGPLATASDNLDYASNPALLRAAATAERKVPGSRLTSIEVEDSGARWEATVATSDGTERTMMVSRHGTCLLSGPTTTSDDPSNRAEHRRRLRDARLDYRQAALRVAGAVPEGRITELGLDGYRGTTVWEADVLVGTGEKHALRIDARSGDVLTHQTPDK